MKTKKHAPTAVATSSGRPSGSRWRASAPTKESGAASASRTVAVSHRWNSPASSASSSCRSGAGRPQNSSSDASLQRTRVAGSTPSMPSSSISTRQGRIWAKVSNRSHSPPAAVRAPAVSSSSSAIRSMTGTAAATRWALKKRVTVRRSP
ncbi:hypothetical protein [Streptomyces sp. MS191]|uniref:hypothetical protein n=1 Tax=Streptomyces sp. ms191 TaxID=1827978 RepID=UPI0021C95ED6|nr:hypothetical protein [Streptomyces sp. ms191]